MLRIISLTRKDCLAPLTRSWVEGAERDTAEIDKLNEQKPKMRAGLFALHLVSFVHSVLSPLSLRSFKTLLGCLAALQRNVETLHNLSGTRWFHRVMP